jgi:hypothetical protein
MRRRLNVNAAPGQLKCLGAFDFKERFLKLRPLLRWLLFVLFVVAGLMFLNGAIFNAWASDVPPRLYSEVYRQRANTFGLISIEMFLLSGLSVWFLKPRKNLRETNEVMS